MRGDFARLTFDPKKHYTGVLHQQGRVWLEADWNEDVHNRQHLLQQEIRDIIGACGTPEPGGTAFKISASTSSYNPGDPLDFNIGCGHYYVDGILCQLDEDNTTYTTQPDLPAAPTISFPQTGEELRNLVYLEVWQRFITHLEDDSLREIALGGPDTAARLKTIAQVKFLPITEELTCTQASDLLRKKSQGKLTTLQPEDSQPADLCHLPDPATYTGRENRLYRIEIHNGGDVAGTGLVELKLPLALDVEIGATTLKLKNALTPPQIDVLTRSGVVRLMDEDGHQEILIITNASSDTLTLRLSPSYHFTVAKNAYVIGNIARFKWSRDNASFAVSVKAVSEDRKTLTLSSMGRDQATMLRQLDLVEISDDASELGPAVGHLTELLDTDPDQLTVTLAEPLPPNFLLTKEGKSERHMILRRWDGQGWANAKFDATATPDMNLEDGIHIQFGGKNLQPGDYWQFAARSADGTVEKLTDAPPMGIERHYCPLAIVKWAYQYRFDHSMLLEAFKKIQLSPQQIDHLNGILLTTFGESKPIIADITEILNLARHVDLSAEQLQGLHELLLRVEPQVMFTMLKDCRSQFPALTELTGLFYVSGDGQEVTPDLTNASEQFFHLRQPLCVGVANGNKPVAGATVQFKIIADPFPQGAKGKLQNDGTSVDILTGQNGLAFCDWQLWFDSTQPKDVQQAILSQQVEAHLLDDGGNTIYLPVRFTANLSVAAGVAYDPKDCGNLQDAKTVQQAIDHLCKMDSNGWRLTGNASTDPSTNFLGTTDEKPLVIKTNAKEAMRIDPTGKVGIGITQPDATLQVNSGEAGPTLPQIHITGDHAGLLQRTPAILRLTDSGMYSPSIPPPPRYIPGTSWDIRADGQLHLSTSEGDVMNLTADGNVGIGTVELQHRLQVGHDVAGIGFDASDASPNAGYIRFGDNTGWKLHFGRSRESAGGAINAGTTGLLMTIQDKGNVGIGTMAPDAKLHVTSGDDYNLPQVHIYQTTHNEFARLRFSSTTTEPDGSTMSTPPWDIAVGGGGLGKMNFFQQGIGNVMTLNVGNVGIGTESPEAKLHVVGDLKVTGNKQFVQVHPTDPTKEIVYISLEGGEAGTYMRGTWKLDNGKAVIELPEHFSMVTSEDGLTVQLTPRGEWLQLYVVQVDTKQIIVQEAQGKSGQFDYLIQGVRKGYEHHEVIQERK